MLAFSKEILKLFCAYYMAEVSQKNKCVQNIEYFITLNYICHQKKDFTNE